MSRGGTLRKVSDAPRRARGSSPAGEVVEPGGVRHDPPGAIRILKTYVARQLYRVMTELLTPRLALAAKS